MSPDPAEEISLSDRLAIHELLSLYGFVVDDRDYGRVGELFTDDVFYDMSDFGLGTANGPAEVVAMWETSDQHPISHHVTNVVITSGSATEAEVRCLGLGVGGGGRVGSVEYADSLRRTADGWRLSRRTGTLRRAPAVS